MSHSVIFALSPETVQKIAAGEVVERPANAVKELVENSLDAGATRIAILLEDGGKDLIRISDNGIGMTRQDLETCFLPHTTSKIKIVEDLEQVMSFGFRGEALSSMAAVAEIVIETRHRDEDSGFRALIREGALVEIEVAARAQGTTITVRKLFGNNPVRRKFLGTGKAEGARIVSALQRVALSHPHAGFKITENNRDLINLTESPLRRRVADVLGNGMLEELLPVDFGDAGLQITGFISIPGRYSGRMTGQYLFVNRRVVQSPMIGRALEQAYGNLPPGKHPLAVLFLTLPPFDIDVNIHPTKREIRFLHESKVFFSMQRAVREGLRKALHLPELDFPDMANSEANLEPKPNGEGVFIAFPTFSAGTDSPNAESYQQATDFNSQGGNSDRRTPLNQQYTENPNQRQFSATPIASRQEDQIPIPYGAAPMLQLHRAFIVLEVTGGFLLVNQQAAHERILYEKALLDLRQPGRLSSQQLLLPELLETTPEQGRRLEDHDERLRALGFEIESFGPNVYQLRALPAEMKTDRARQILVDMIDALPPLGRESNPNGEGDDPLLARIAKVYARGAGIRRGEPLDAASMQALMDGLFAARNPYVSPSGTPVILRYGLDEIQRRLGISNDLGPN